MSGIQVGDLVQRKLKHQGVGWESALRCRGKPPYSLMTVQYVETNGGIVLQGLENSGPWFWDWFDKVTITDLEGDDDDCI